MRALQIRRLGLVEYADGLELQRQFIAARAANLVPDTLLLLEHPRVITLGRGAKDGNILWSKELLRERGFELFETDRGGDVTYHGPGQLVGYPILDLKPDRKDVRKYVRSVEEVMIRLAASYGVRAGLVAGRVGIWVEGAGKLGAIGVHLSRWITSHGFAFNVSTALEDFAAIVPCGLRDAGVTSLQALLGAGAPTFAQVEARAAEVAAEVWESEAAEVLPALRTISVTIVRGEELLLLQRVPERGGFWQTLTGRLEMGESPLAAAAREIFEETGYSPRLEEIVELSYAHSFALDRALAGLPAGGAPVLVHETAYALRVPEGSEPRLDPREHQSHRFAPLADALATLPFAGLRKAATLTSR